MDWGTWIAVGGFATILSGAILLTDIDEVWFGLPAAFSWLIFAYGASAVEICTGGACHATMTYISLQLFGAGMAVMMILVLLRGAATMLHPDTAAEEGWATDE